jgi:hypothetical protein
MTAGRLILRNNFDKATIPSFSRMPIVPEKFSLLPWLRQNSRTGYSFSWKVRISWTARATGVSQPYYSLTIDLREVGSLLH